MQYFNTDSLLDQEFDTILKGHEAELDQYLVRTLPETPRESINKRKGEYNKLPQTHGNAQDAEAVKDVEVEPGEETPKGETDLDLVQFKCQYRKKAKGINDLDKIQLDEGMDELDTRLKDAAHDVLVAAEYELIDLLKGNGDDTGHNHQAIRTKTLSGGDGVDGSNVLDTFEDIQRSGTFTRCVMGENVAMALARNAEVIGASGMGSHPDQSKIPFAGIENFMREHFGITTTRIGQGRYSDGDRSFDYKYAHLHDDILYFDDGQNIVRAELVPFQYDEFEDNDREMSFARAKMDAALNVNYTYNSMAVTNPFA